MTPSEDTLESRLRSKLEEGEISQGEFDELYKKFSDLGILDAKTPPKRRKGNWVFSGSKVFDKSARTDGPVIVNGSLTVNGDLECQKLNTSGSLKVTENLTVKNKATISGKLEVEKQVKVGDNLIIAGKLGCGNDVVCTGSIKISGKSNVSGDIVCGKTLKISGYTYSKNIHSAGSVKVIGRIDVEENVVAESFISRFGGRSKIGGSLKCKSIKIGNPTENKVKVVANGVDLSQFLDSMISSFVPKNLHHILTVKNVFGENIEMDQVTVAGDIRGDTVKLGKNVTVGGTVYYTESLSVFPGMEITSERVVS